MWFSPSSTEGRLHIQDTTSSFGFRVESMRVHWHVQQDLLEDRFHLVLASVVVVHFHVAHIVAIAVLLLDVSSGDVCSVEELPVRVYCSEYAENVQWPLRCRPLRRP